MSRKKPQVAHLTVHEDKARDRGISAVEREVLTYCRLVIPDWRELELRCEEPGDLAVMLMDEILKCIHAYTDHFRANDVEDIYQEHAEARDPESFRGVQ